MSRQPLYYVYELTCKTHRLPFRYLVSTLTNQSIALNLGEGAFASFHQAWVAFMAAWPKKLCTRLYDLLYTFGNTVLWRALNNARLPFLHQDYGNVQSIEQASYLWRPQLEKQPCLFHIACFFKLNSNQESGMCVIAREDGLHIKRTVMQVYCKFRSHIHFNIESIEGPQARPSLLELVLCERAQNSSVKRNVPRKQTAHYSLRRRLSLSFLHILGSVSSLALHAAPQTQLTWVTPDRNQWMIADTQFNRTARIHAVRA